MKIARDCLVSLAVRLHDAQGNLLEATSDAKVAARGPVAPMKITNGSLPAQTQAPATQPQQIPGAAAPTGLQTVDRQYTGRPVSIDIENGDLRAATN